MPKTPLPLDGYQKIFLPGSDVYIRHGEIDAVVTRVLIGHNVVMSFGSARYPVQYEVVWWDGDNRRTALMHEDELLFYKNDTTGRAAIVPLEEETHG